MDKIKNSAQDISIEFKNYNVPNKDNSTNIKNVNYNGNTDVTVKNDDVIEFSNYNIKDVNTSFELTDDMIKNGISDNDYNKLLSNKQKENKNLQTKIENVIDDYTKEKNMFEEIDKDIKDSTYETDLYIEKYNNGAIAAIQAFNNGVNDQEMLDKYGLKTSDRGKSYNELILLTHQTDEYEGLLNQRGKEVEEAFKRHEYTKDFRSRDYNKFVQIKNQNLYELNVLNANLKNTKNNYDLLEYSCITLLKDYKNQEKNLSNLIENPKGDQKYINQLGGDYLKIYNYLRENDKGKVKEYVDAIQDQINQKKGQEAAENRINKLLKDNKGNVTDDLVNYLSTSKYGFGDGVYDFGEGFYKIFTDGEMTAQDYETMYYLTYLNEHGTKQADVYSVAQGVGHMTPTVAAATLVSLVAPEAAPYVTSSLIGLSSFGTTKNQMLYEGYDYNKALLYSALSASSDAVLEVALGGIENVGINAAISSAEKQTFRQALGAYILSMGQEGCEEVIQNTFQAGILDTMVLGKDVKYEELTEENLKTFFQSAAVAGILNAGTSTFNLTLEGGKQFIINQSTLESVISDVKNGSSYTEAFENNLDYDLQFFSEKDLVKNSWNHIVETKDGIALGKNNPNSLSTNESSVYRITGIDQINDIVDSGYVKAKGYGSRSDRMGDVVYWSKGSDKLYYYDLERFVLEVDSSKIKDHQEGAISINDLSAIWQFEDNKWVNKLDEYKKKYQEKNGINNLDYNLQFFSDKNSESNFYDDNTQRKLDRYNELLLTFYSDGYKKYVVDAENDYAVGIDKESIEKQGYNPNDYVGLEEEFLNLQLDLKKISGVENIVNLNFNINQYIDDYVIGADYETGGYVKTAELNWATKVLKRVDNNLTTEADAIKIGKIDSRVNEILELKKYEINDSSVTKSKKDEIFKLVDSLPEDDRHFVLKENYELAKLYLPTSEETSKFINGDYDEAFRDEYIKKWSYAIDGVYYNDISIRYGVISGKVDLGAETNQKIMDLVLKNLFTEKNMPVSYIGNIMNYLNENDIDYNTLNIPGASKEYFNLYNYLNEAEGKLKDFIGDYPTNNSVEDSLKVIRFGIDDYIQNNSVSGYNNGIYSQVNPLSIAAYEIIIHETLHQIAHNKKVTGLKVNENFFIKHRAINEATTELFTSMIMGDKYLNVCAYGNMVVELKKLINGGVLDINDLKQAYFTNDINYLTNSLGLSKIEAERLYYGFELMNYRKGTPEVNRIQVEKGTQIVSKIVNRLILEHN